MSDFATALRRIQEHGDSMLTDAAEMLRALVGDTCKVISAAEGSILVPSQDQTELQFLVSVNPALDSSDITVPVDGSISGYVFSSRQAIAKVRPESPGVSKVDELAQLSTEYLLAVPIIDDDGVYGVATFVNRSGEFLETPFSANDLKTAQAFGEIYATGMKLYRKVEFGSRIARIEIAEHAGELDVEGIEKITEIEDEVRRYRLPSVIAKKAMDLPHRECELLARMADVLTEYSEESDEYDL
tara:strand:+ start:598 stop:1326 length:729 start_codon:yes stop_codon:yes gene_type:complete